MLQENAACIALDAFSVTVSMDVGRLMVSNLAVTSSDFSAIVLLPFLVGYIAGNMRLCLWSVVCSGTRVQLLPKRQQSGRLPLLYLPMDTPKADDASKK